MSSKFQKYKGEIGMILGLVVGGLIGWFVLYVTK